MSTDWEAEAKDIYDSYKEENFEIIIRLEGDVAWDESIGANVKITPDIDYKTYALRGEYSMFDLANSDINAADSKLFFSGHLLPEITNDYKIVASGKVLEVITVKPTATAGFTYAYEAQVRGF